MQISNVKENSEVAICIFLTQSTETSCLTTFHMKMTGPRGPTEYGSVCDAYELAEDDFD